ncbi:MAG: DoxX family membrane protein [Acidobacteriota bacterium]
MKVVAIIARILLGLMFFVAGLNGFFNFLHGQLPAGVAGTFANALVVSHFIYFIAAVQLIAGALLLINRYVPLALALLAPVLYNILAFHISMQPSGLPPGLVACLFWLILAWRLRVYFAPLLTQKAVEK